MNGLPAPRTALSRFELLADFTDPFGGYKHTKGETGSVLHVCESVNEALIEFDGYEDSKRKAKEFAEKYGEYPNCVPHLTVVSCKMLDIKAVRLR